MHRTVAMSLWCILAMLLPAAAQVPTVDAQQIAQNPRAYLNAPIALRGVYCYGVDGRYECTTSAALKLVLEDAPSGPAKAAMDEECGALDGIEQSPTCRFALEIVPTEARSEVGETVRGGRSVRGRITVITATVSGMRRE